MSKPVVLVTGSGKGLGRAISEQFHRNGYTVVATDYAESLVADLSDKDGYLTAAVDVTDSESTADIANFIQEKCGRLDVIVNNAGIIGYFPTAEMDPEKIIYHFQVNSFGALRITHHCLDLLQQSGGRVVNITSESYRLRTPFQIYQATKLALEGISDTLRRELSHLGIHVATIRPGAIRTDLFNAMDTISNPVENSRLAAPFAAFVKNLEKNKPTRVSEPAEVAALVFKAATDPNKKPHYEMNNMLALKIANMLPASLVDRLVSKALN